MYFGFFTHSPLFAQSPQLGLSSWQMAGSRYGGSKEPTWIHLVADHFSPSTTGQPVCREAVSKEASGFMLKKRRASPLRGFTAFEKEARKAYKRTHQQHNERHYRTQDSKKGLPCNTA